jgi:lipoyl(octanoyl) transferase
LDNLVEVKFANLGRQPYQEIWDFQESCLQKIVGQKIASRTDPAIKPDLFLFFVEHPSVFTLGKSGKESHLLIPEHELHQKGIQFYKINRGGDITFHGPGQLVGYPIWDLDQIYTDIHRYLREIEEVIILTLAEFGITNGSRKEGLTGVWVNEEKICAIGVRASRWVTMHGFALNVNTDLSNFDLIVPCGITNKGVTSMMKILGNEVNMEAVQSALLRNFEKIFPIKFRPYEV